MAANRMARQAIPFGLSNKPFENGMESRAMNARSDRQLPQLMRTLRQVLRGNGLTIRAIAERMDVSEATVKRWFQGQGLGADRLEELCELAGLRFTELAELAHGPPRELAHQLTLAQEQALTESTFLSFLFFMIMSGWPPYDLHDDFDVPLKEIEEQLTRLERLALIDRLPGGRVRSRIDRRVAWRRGPMRQHFEQHMKRQFMEIDFGDPNAIYTAETAKLSASGVAQLEELLQRFRLDAQKLADDDRRHSLLARQWTMVLVAVRPLDVTRLRALAEVSQRGGPLEK